VTSTPFGGLSDLGEASRFKEPKYILRLVGMFFALVCFSCAASLPWYNDHDAFQSFLVFVGVMAFLFDIFFLITYFLAPRIPTIIGARLPMVEFILSLLWVIFWFAGTTAYAANAGKLYTPGPESTANGAIAFGYFAFVVWIADTFFAVRRLREAAPSTSLPYSSV